MIDLNKELVVLRMYDVEGFLDLDHHKWGDLSFLVKEIDNNDYVIVDKVDEKDMKERIKECNEMFGVDEFEEEIKEIIGGKNE